jgi:crotonobetainyl-CoA:carnitine CoA-transferase CaiB-like acyl-CoA transferase
VKTLDDLRVVECASEIAGPYCGKLFIDAGAEVIKVEPPTGDPFRRRAPYGVDLGGKDPALFRYLNAGKRSVTAESRSDELEALVASADIVIDDGVPSHIEIEELRRANPELVVVSITPYGRDNSWERRPATEFTVQAEGGDVGGRGRLSRPPHQAGGRLAEWMTGTYAAVGGLAAAFAARTSGFGEHVDVSMIETSATAFTVSHMWLIPRMFPGGMDGPARMVERPAIVPTADGWVGFTTHGRHQFDAFLILIGRTDLLGDEELATKEGRARRGEEWDRLVAEATKGRTTEDLMEHAKALRVPAAPVLDGETVALHPQIKERGVLVSSADHDFLQPLPPYLIDGERSAPPRKSPVLGEANGKIATRTRQRRDEDHQPGSRPLDGVRVIDATAWWAGPMAGQLLALLGADVIHVESVSRPDAVRTVTPPTPGPWWERSPCFFGNNAGKRGITLDLDDPRGLELMKRLIAKSDVVLENFSPRVFERFGLDWPQVRAANDQAIFARMPAFGLDGPWRDRVGFAQTMEQITGLASATGFPDEPPMMPRGPCDPNAGVHAVFAILLALRRREQTGKGSLVEVPMVESALNLAAEQVITYSAYGTLIGREGNHGPDASPQNVYACREKETWIALAIQDDAQWRALVGVLGAPAWATDPALETVEGRCDRAEAVDAKLEQWFADKDLGEVVERLTEVGVPAGKVTDPRRLDEHPRLLETGFFEFLEIPEAGRQPVPRAPFRFERIEAWYTRPSPTLGEHNAEVLDELGLSRSEQDELEEAGVIGRTPTSL